MNPRKPDLIMGGAGLPLSRGVSKPVGRSPLASSIAAAGCGDGPDFLPPRDGQVLVLVQEAAWSKNGVRKGVGGPSPD